MEVFGYVYLWFDRTKKMFYLGSHYGSLTRRYRGSNAGMIAAYQQRPQDFSMRVLWYLKEPNKKLLRTYEQYFLDLIKESELSTPQNVLQGTNRYYNLKKQAIGGNGSANKGKTTIGGWNKGLKRLSYWKKTGPKPKTLKGIGGEKVSTG